ncbi:MAG: FecR domain-containing protein [Pseudomonadota bacterium]
MTKGFSANFLKTLLPVLVVILAFVSVGNAAAENPSLPDDLKGIPVQNSFVPLDADVIGTVQSVVGKLIVRHGREQSAYYASPGDRLYVHDTLYALDQSRCRVQFTTADIVTLGEQCRISVDQYADDRASQKKRSFFNLVKGKAMFYAMRLLSYRSADIQVRTPTAVAGVRGTKFGVMVEEIDNKSASAGPVYLADVSGNLPAGLLAQNEGNTQTTVFGFDGSITVTSTIDGSTQTVGAGQDVIVGPTGIGPVNETPPALGQDFIQATDAPAGEDSGDSPSGSGDTTDNGTDAAPDTATDTTMTTNENAATDITSELTFRENIVEAAAGVQGPQVGYFTALLTRYNPYPSPFFLADVYVPSSRVNFQNTQVSANSIVDPLGSITVTNTSNQTDDTTYVQKIVSKASIPQVDTGDLGTGAPMDVLGEDIIGTNSYMEWGFWKMSQLVRDQNDITETGPTYAVTNKAFFIEGSVTPDAAVNGISGTYMGDAWGTYFNGGGGTEMNGSFSCDVNGAARTVSNFILNAYGTGGATAHISGTGVFNAASGEFKINTGTFQLNGTNAANQSVVGSLYGPNGEHIGGAWAMDQGSGNNAAVGIFAGNKEAM